MTLDKAYFDGVYERSSDPWGFEQRWYEERKRALTLGLLPQESYDSIVEVGCSIGVLTVELAKRCSSLLATDVSASAVEAATDRCAELPHVSVRESGAWPNGAFDLAVLSEVLYYFDREEALVLASRAAEADTVLAVHWRHPVADYPLSGDQAHELLALVCAGAGHVVIGSYLDDDMVAAVWSRDRRSVAARQGLV